MADQLGDKRHEATPFRRQQAREQGQVARSQDLASAILLVVGVAMMLVNGHKFSAYFVKIFHSKLADRPSLQVDANTTTWLLQRDAWELGLILIPALGALLLAALVANIGQTGLLFLPEKLNLDIKRLNPISGLKRIFAVSGFVRLLFGLFKVIIIAGVAAISLWGQRAAILGMAAIPIGEMSVFLVETALWTALKIGVALLVLALLDYLFQRWKFNKDLMMTDQEIRDEMKILSGDPQIAARRRAIQRQLTLNRMASIVPKADVVVTNPTELAIAIRYDFETMPAPLVLAKGAGVLAQRIRRLALENDIPIVERKELAQSLYKEVEVNEAIPSEQYAVVAEILRYVYELKGENAPRPAA
jgi:flagellar biosynthetic protein FlhB